MRTESKIKGLSISKMESLVEKAADIVHEVVQDDHNQTGAILVVADSRSGLPLFMCLVRDLSEQDIRECQFYAMEKATRLAENSHHQASSQSRDLSVEPKRYGGAVRTKNYIFSMSGLTEEQDEAAMLVLGILTGELEISQAVRVACPDNFYFSKLHVKMSP